MIAKTIQITPAVEPLAGRVADLIPGLVRSTGPVSYDYQFGPGDLLTHVVSASWKAPKTLFSAGCATLALEGGELLGVEIGFAGADFYIFRNNLAALAPGLIAGGQVDYDAFVGLVERAGLASYLNAHVPDDVYYLHALATPEQHRGRGVGRDLLRAAIARAQIAGFRELQLDVLADNPAVDFYQAMGLQILAEVHSPLLSRDHGFPGEYRMAVTL
ncbi:MAG: GNAT family N-acetyltransferase [Caulobacterales bacterium]|nr:GNAT family N-acetyltransferase [Caulobacterales bacterium]